MFNPALNQSTTVSAVDCRRAPSTRFCIIHRYRVRFPFLDHCSKSSPALVTPNGGTHEVKFLAGCSILRPLLA
jgi:hypothetical protein